MTTYGIFELATITPSLTNPRKTFDPVKLAELAESIKVSGMHQPILVRRLPGSRIADTDRTITHEIISGERRYRASLLAGASNIPALICEMTDAQVLDAQIVENLQRDDLTDLEEAIGYQTLMQAAGSSTEQVAVKIGKSTSYVRNKLRLLALCPEAQTSLRAGDIDYSRALLLATIPDHQLQIKALGCLSEKNYQGDYQTGVRGAAEFVSRTYRLRLDRARFDAISASLLPGAGACNTCHKRTGQDPDLFAQAKSADLCLDPPCYQQKEAAHTAALLAAAHAAGQTVIEGREAKALMPNGWGKVEGYLRLDDVADSPSDKPLRELLGKALEASSEKPTLLANPHKDGELIALLPTATVAELLKASQHQQEAKRLESRHTDSKKADAAAAKTKAKQEYEQAWRDLLLQRTWDEINQSGRADTLSDAVLRHIAEHYAKACNGDRAGRLCQILELGKVAPKEALLYHAQGTTRPATLLQLLIMHADVEYHAYLETLHPGWPVNQGLMLVANSYGVDVESVKAECKTATRAKIRKSANPDAPPGKLRKTSAKDAQAQIAKAMQQQDSQGEAEPTAEDSPMDPVQPAIPTVLAEGVRVRVTKVASRLPKHQQYRAGQTGTISQKLGDRAWMVSFDGRQEGMGSFDGGDLTIVPPEVTGATPGRPVAYRGPNGETWSGRGLRPKWMTHYLDNGGTLADIKVAGAAA
jgi:ParB/RepB/Spo0J family partition protein